MSQEGLERAVRQVAEEDARVTNFGDNGPVGRGLVAVAWGLVAIAEALSKADRG